MRVVVATLVGALLLTSQMANARPTIAPGTYHIRITSQLIKQDKGKRLVLAASALYNKHISSYAIGNSISRCTIMGHKRTFPEGTLFCNVVFRMPLGQIVTAGVVTSRVYYRLAVTGGTGVYSNVGGQVRVITTKLKPHKENLVFSLRAF